METIFINSFIYILYINVIKYLKKKKNLNVHIQFIILPSKHFCEKLLNTLNINLIHLKMLSDTQM